MKTPQVNPNLFGSVPATIVPERVIHVIAHVAEV